MTVEAWLQSRMPAPPPALARRIVDTVNELRPMPDAALADVLLDAGQRLLEGLLSADHLTRNGAADLLTADALVTYAFEASADEPEHMEQRARVAMSRLAALAAAEAP